MSLCARRIFQISYKCRKIKKSVKFSENSPRKKPYAAYVFRLSPSSKNRSKMPFIRYLAREFPEFQPTRPWGTRQKRQIPDLQTLRHFNPLVPCGTRPYCVRVGWRVRISTHASLAGRDALLGALCAQTDAISTHASLAGRDLRVLPRGGAEGCDFNPRVPCGTRPS